MEGYGDITCPSMYASIYLCMHTTKPFEHFNRSNTLWDILPCIIYSKVTLHETYTFLKEKWMDYTTGTLKCLLDSYGSGILVISTSSGCGTPRNMESHTGQVEMGTVCNRMGFLFLSLSLCTPYIFLLWCAFLLSEEHGTENVFLSVWPHLQRKAAVVLAQDRQQTTGHWLRHIETWQSPCCRLGPPWIQERNSRGWLAGDAPWPFYTTEWFFWWHHTAGASDQLCLHPPSYGWSIWPALFTPPIIRLEHLTSSVYTPPS